MNKSLWHALGTALSCWARWHQRLYPTLWHELLGHRSRVHPGSPPPACPAPTAKVWLCFYPQGGHGDPPEHPELQGLTHGLAQGLKLPGKGLGSPRCGSCPSHLPWPSAKGWLEPQASPAERGFGWQRRPAGAFSSPNPSGVRSRSPAIRVQKQTVVPRLAAPQRQPGHRKRPSSPQLGSSC